MNIVEVIMYYAVSGRCAVPYELLDAGLGIKDNVNYLEEIGFTFDSVDVVDIARELVGKSTYLFGAHPGLAPDIVDCSSFTQWVYGRSGVRIPRFSVQQRVYGSQKSLAEVCRGDLVFTVSSKNWMADQPGLDVGHVGIATGDDSVIHASRSSNGVSEVKFCDFMRRGFRGVCRIFEGPIIVAYVPPNLFVDSSDDIKWILKRRLG